jgi:hypothetical protein
MAAGKLIAAIQKEWVAEAGEPESAASEEVLHHSHELLQASKKGSIKAATGPCTIDEFLGRCWVAAHPRVWPHIQLLETLERGPADISD